MVLANPLWLTLLLLVPVAWFLFRRKGFVGFSDVRRLGTAQGMGSRFFHMIPHLLLALAFVALTVALARPQKVHVLSGESFKARDIIIAVDKSGSMGGTLAGEMPERTTAETDLDKEMPPRPPRKDMPQARDPWGRPMEAGHRRIDAAQLAVLEFVRSRYIAQAGDRIGIMVFDTDQYWSWPITHDLKTIYRKGDFVNDGVGGGTNFGEMKPGPIDAAAEHFDELGKSVTKVLILVTDGEDMLSESTMKRLADILGERGIRIYVVGIGETLARRDVDIIRFVEAVGGKAFRVENAGDLPECFKTIDEMERSVVQVETSEKRDELFFYFAFASIVLLLLGTLGEALFLNQ